MSAKKQARGLFVWFATVVDPGFRSPAAEATAHWTQYIEQELEKAEVRGARMMKEAWAAEVQDADAIPLDPEEVCAKARKRK